MKAYTIIAAAALLATATVRADEPSNRKPGEWQVTATGPNGVALPPRTVCYPTGSLDDMFRNQGACTKSNVHQVGNTTTLDAVCTSGSQRVSWQTTITALSNTASHSSTHFTYSPPIHGMSTMDYEADLKWIGPCQAGE